MSELIASATALEMNKLDQIAALPIGARIKVDPWNDRAHETFLEVGSGLQGEESKQSPAFSRAP
jgi:hypothetical protein